MVEHPLVRLVYETKIPSRNPRGIGQYLAEALDFVLHREGMLASVFEATGFVKSADDLATPDIQFHFLPLGVLDPVQHAAPLLKAPSLTIYANLSHPTGRGALKLASKDPGAPPRIHPNLLATDRDVDALASALRIARRIMRTPRIASLVAGEVTPGPLVESDAALRAHVRSNCEIAYHIAGTCRMGSDPHAVVSSDLKLNGSENVWIADASIFPDLISGNTNAACMMIGTKLAQQLVGRGGAGADAMAGHSA
jgi:choline dehydrogenase-like flavoprotein